MNAAVLYALGETPRAAQFPDPVPADGELLIQVKAAALKPVDKQLASGSHYGAGSRPLPGICGIDGVGVGEDGVRVFFLMPRPPFGAMAERTVVSPKFCFPIPDEVDDSTAAAIFNPGLSAWASLAWRAQLAADETVLILGATGVTGKLAIQIAKILGAKRVIAAGRNEQVLDTLPSLGADATIRLDDSREAMIEKFANVSGEGAIDVVLDYLWGAPTEALLAAITRKDLKAASGRTRLVQVGESAGATISLAAATLRSSRLEILGAGTGSAAPLEKWADARRELMTLVAAGKLRIDIERVPLAEIEKVWHREANGRRFVIVP